MSNPDNRTRTAQQVFARISKGRGCELRVLLTTWRGEQRLEIREATATVPNVFMPTGAGRRTCRRHHQGGGGGGGWRPEVKPYGAFASATFGSCFGTATVQRFPTTTRASKTYSNFSCRSRSAGTRILA
jgi:hypothetical protein